MMRIRNTHGCNISLLTPEGIIDVVIVARDVIGRGQCGCPRNTSASDGCYLNVVQFTVGFDMFTGHIARAADNGFDFPYLYDESQAVAKAYRAACTPDFFGFNRDLGLQYRGRLDASRNVAGPVDLRRDLFEAMKQVAETGQGPQEQIASIGCSIKWKSA